MYPTLDGLPVIPSADLLVMHSEANRPGVGAARTGSTPRALGKRPGMEAWRDAGSGALSLVFATGAKTSDGWRACDGSTSYTPVNINPLAAGYTIGADCTYVSGLLTSDGGNDAAGRCVQSVTLTAGKYRLSGTAAYEGTRFDHVTPLIRIGTAADAIEYGQVIVGRTAGHTTAAEDANPKETFSIDFEKPTDGATVFTLRLVDEAGALIAGSAFIRLNPLEAIY